MASASSYPVSRLFSLAIFALPGGLALWNAATEASIGSAIVGIGLVLFGTYMFLKPVLLRGSPANSRKEAAAGSEKLRKSLMYSGLGLYLLGSILRLALGL